MIQRINDVSDILAEVAVDIIPVSYTHLDVYKRQIKGLRSGAEDYIVKPFEVLELLVRVEKVLERTGKQKEIIQAVSYTHLVMHCLRAINTTKHSPEAARVLP